MSGTSLPGALWRKSSYSNGQANCVEVAVTGASGTAVAVRDSKAPGVTLAVETHIWQRFIDALAAVNSPD